MKIFRINRPTFAKKRLLRPVVGIKADPFWPPTVRWPVKTGIADHQTSGAGETKVILQPKRFVFSLPQCKRLLVRQSWQTRCCPTPACTRPAEAATFKDAQRVRAPVGGQPWQSRRRGGPIAGMRGWTEGQRAPR